MRRHRISSGRIPSWVGAWLRDSSALAMSQGLLLATNLVLLALVARYLAPAEFGVFAGAMGIAMALGLYMDAGLATWLLRELVPHYQSSPPVDPRESRLRPQQLVSSALLVNTGLGAALLVGGVATAAIAGASLDLVSALAALLVYAALVSAATTLEAWFRARRSIGRVVAAQLVEKLALGVLIVVALTADLGIAGIAVAYTGAGIFRFGVNIWGGRGVVRASAATWSSARYIARRSAPLAVSATTATAIVRMDPFLVGLVSPLAAGLYAVGDRVLTAALVIPATAGVALYPHLARGRRSYADPARIAALLGAAGGVLGLCGVVLAPMVITPVLGAEYADAIGVVQIMLIGLPFAFASGALLTGLLSAGHETGVLRYVVPGTALGSILIVLGQLWGGVMWAAGGSVVRFVIQFSALAVLTRMFHITHVRRSDLELRAVGHLADRSRGEL